MVDCESQGSEVRDQCGVAMQAALRVLEGRWKMMILAQLFYSGRVMRLSELKREIADISQKMLIQQLRALEVEGIVERTVYPVVPPKVEYALTDLGRELGPVFASLLAWADLKQATTPAAAIASA
jgi:DNA-binding HxlR family transcriptional regulator